MIVELDLSTVPPHVTLREPDDFTALKVMATRAADAFVAPEELERLAGAHAAAPGWQSGFATMLRHAEAQGWLRDDGDVQAHIEWR